MTYPHPHLGSLPYADEISDGAVEANTKIEIEGKAATVVVYGEVAGTLSESGERGVQSGFVREFVSECVASFPEAADTAIIAEAYIEALVNSALDEAESLVADQQEDA